MFTQNSKSIVFYEFSLQGANGVDRLLQPGLKCIWKEYHSWISIDFNICVRVLSEVRTLKRGENCENKKKSSWKEIMRYKLIEKLFLKRTCLEICHLWIISFMKIHFDAHNTCRTTQAFSSRIRHTEKTDIRSSHWKVFFENVCS